MFISREKYLTAVGKHPSVEELERANCNKAGQSGHRLCGWNHQQDKPVALVGPEKKEPTT